MTAPQPQAGPAPRGSLVAHAVTDWAVAAPGRIALCAGSVRRSYAELDHRTDRLAQALLGRGLRKGDRVGIWMANRVEYVETYLAAAKAGLVVVPVNIRFTAEEARFLLVDSGTRALVYDDSVAERVTELGIADDLGPCLNVGVDVAGLPFERVLGEGARSMPAAPAPDDLMTIGYTSGTTGFPKGAELTHRSITNLGLTNAMSCRYTIGSIQVFGLSLSFTATVPAHILPHLAVGGTTVLLDSWDTGRVVDEIERWRADFLILPTPAITEFVAEVAGRPSRVSSLKSVLHSASKAPAEQLGELTGVIGSRLVEGWGMTENSGGLLTATSARDYQDRGPEILESAGRAVPGTLVRVIADDGSALPHDGSTVGQLVARSGSVARGYWNRPEDTEATFGGGWYRTGDLGTVDPDGYVTVIDRRSDLIVSGGMNVYPSEVERVLLELPGVLECAVVAVAHPRWGQTPVAYFTTSGSIDTAGVREHCRARLASYKLPSRFEVCASLPRNTSGKILRRELARLAALG